MKPFDFNGRTIAVTGARGGLGQALISQLNDLGGIVTPVSRDTKWEPSKYDVLFLNAGFGMIQPADIPVILPDTFEMFHVNLITTIETAQRALAGGASHVHVVGSILSIVSSPHMALYAATKYGLRGWAYGAARECPGRVSISYPNGIRTNYFTNLKGHEPLLDHYRSQVEAAQSSYDTPDDVASGIIDGIRYGAREIVPTKYALDWFTSNGEDVRRMWTPGLKEPSRMKWDWWGQIAAHYDAQA